MATDSKKKKNTAKSTASKSTANGTTGKKTMSKKQRAKRKRRRMLIFVLEIFVIAIMLVILWGVIQAENIGRVEIKEEDIVINEEVQESEVLKGYRNIALFGVDSTTGALTKNTRSDTIIIASVNLDTGDIRLCSVYRDTYLNRGNDSYNKCNGAYAMGGPEQAINMLNMNMDLNITDFVTIGFAGLKDVIDALGGVEINVSDDEIVHINSYQSCIAKDLKLGGFTEVTHSGLQTLNGLQATAYCRVRYTRGDDFKRAERQRTVLLAVMEKAKKASVSELTTIANNVFSEVYTSLDLQEIIELLGDIAKFNVVGNDGFPQADLRTTGTIGTKGSCVVPMDLESNVVWLHRFLFEDEDYSPSEAVKKYDAQIESDTSKYVGMKGN